MKKLGELLVEREWLTRDQLTQALRHQQVFGGRLGSCLLELTLLSEDRLIKALSDQLGVPPATAEDLRVIAEGLIEMVPAKLAGRVRAVPFERFGNALSVAVVDTRDLMAQDELSFVTSRRLKVHVAPEVRILEALEKHYGFAAEPRFARIWDRLNRAKYLWQEESAASSGARRRGAEAPTPEPMPTERSQDWKPAPPPPLESGVQRLATAATAAPAPRAAASAAGPVVSTPLAAAVVPAAMPPAAAVEPAPPAKRRWLFGSRSAKQQVAPPEPEIDPAPEPAAPAPPPTPKPARVANAAAVSPLAPTPSTVAGSPAVLPPAPTPAPLASTPVASSPPPAVPSPPAAAAPPSPAVSAPERVAVAPPVAPPPAPAPPTAAARPPAVPKPAGFPPTPTAPAPTRAAPAPPAVVAPVPAAAASSAASDRESLPPAPTPTPLAGRAEVAAPPPAKRDLDAERGDTSPLLLYKPVATLADLEARLAEVEERDDVAHAALSYLSRRFQRTLLFMIRGTTVAAWMGGGEGVDQRLFGEVEIGFGEPSQFLNMREGSPFYRGPLPRLDAHQRLVRSWGGRYPKECLLLPVRIKKRLVAVIYCDRGNDDLADADFAELQQMAALLGRGLESFLVKRKQG